MYQCKAVRTILTMALLVLVASSVKATPDYLTRPGTIAHALLQTDGTCISLDAVKVDKIKARQNPAYFVIVEEWDSTKRLVVDMVPPEVLRMGQTVDVEGELETLPSGERAITSVSLMGYCDRNGVLLRYSPLMKGMSEPAPWPYKMELTAPSSRSRSAETELVPGEPSSEPLPPPTVYPTIAAFRAANPDDGTAAQLGCKPIVSTGSDPTYGAYFIMGEDDSSETLKVYCPTVPSSGARLYDVMGQVRPEGEAQVICTTSGPDYDPQSYEGYSTPAADGTIANVKTMPSGQYVSLSGKVVTETFYQPGTQTFQFFYIQEQPGSLGSDGKRHDYSAIKVTWTGAAVRPGDVVSVTGHVYGTPTYAECYVSASSVTKTATAAIAPPVGMSQKTTAGGQFGLQPALYVNGTSSWVAGSGLDHVGLLTKIWGRLLSGEGTGNGPYSYYLDDGSGLAAFQPGGQTPYSGLKVICSSAGGVDGWKTGEMVSVTGSLGAELSGTYPVPVLRTDLATPVVTDEGTHTASSSQLYIDCSPVNADSEISYKYAIGTTSGGTDVRSWTAAPGGPYILATGLQLTTGHTYYVSVKAINGAGLASPVATTDGIALDTSAPRVGTVSDNRNDYSNGLVPKYKKFELSFGLQLDSETCPGSRAFIDYNPFNPNLVRLHPTESYYYDRPGVVADAYLTKPDGIGIVYPCFWFDDGNGSTCWKLRYAPTAVGDWAYRIVVRYGACVSTITRGSFTCVASDSRGFIRVNQNDKRFLEYQDGTPFYPRGCASTAYDRYADPNNPTQLVDSDYFYKDFGYDIATQTDHGGNFTRVYAVSVFGLEPYYSALGDETNPEHSSSERLNRYRPSRCSNIDSLISSLEQAHLVTEFTVEDPTKLKFNSSIYLYKNPYINHPGIRPGPAAYYDVDQDGVTATNSFFSNEEAKEIYKRKLRYMLARWGYSTSLGILDFMNEIGVNSNARSYARTWHEEMGEFVHGDTGSVPLSWGQSDPNPIYWSIPLKEDLSSQPHLATSSYGSGELRTYDIDYKGAGIDVINYHDYVGSVYWTMNKTDSGSGSPWERLGSTNDCVWTDTAVWADRLGRLVFDRYSYQDQNWNKPVIWEECGYAYGSNKTDWMGGYLADGYAQGLRDAMWSGFFNGVYIQPWKFDWMIGGTPGGSTTNWGPSKFWVFKPFANYLGDVRLAGCTSATCYRNADGSYADTFQPNPKIDSSNPKVMATGMVGSDRAYFYVKNLTVAWAEVVVSPDPDVGIIVVPTPQSQTATITIRGLAQGTYSLHRWSTTDSNLSTQVVALADVNVGSDGIAAISSLSVGTNTQSSTTTQDYDWAYKLVKK